MGQLTADLVYAARSWRQSRSFALIAVLTLALGIAGTIAMFTVVDAVLLTVPFREPERLVTFTAFDPIHSSPWEVSYAEIRAWSDSNSTLGGVAGVSSTNWSSVLDGAPPIQIEYAAVTGTFFDVIGARPLIGRSLERSDDLPGAPRAAVLAFPLWRSRFASDPSVLGRTIRLSGEPFTVIGVMPPTFLYPAGAQLWTALAPALADLSIRDGQDYLNASWFGILAGIGRMKSTATAADAEADLSRLIHRDNIPDARIRVAPLVDAYFGRVRWALLAALASALMLLVIGCVNVGGMLLARMTRRRREWAIRLAIGASNRDLVRLAVIEATLLGSAAAALAISVAPAFTRFIIRLDQSGFLSTYPLHINASVIVGCIATTVATVLLASAGPAFHAARMDAADRLNQSLRHRPATTRGRTILLGIEVALTLLLLAGTVVMVRSVIRLGAIDFGFNPDRLLLVTGALPGDARSPQHDAAVDHILRIIRAFPGVRQVAAVYRAPLQGPIGLDGQLLIEGDPLARESYTRHPAINAEAVTPAYFATMGIPIVAGREFTDHDTADRPPVVIISETLARQLWPGRDPIGQHIFAGFRVAPSRDARKQFIWDTVVGVAADVHYREFDRSRFDVYRPAAQAADVPVQDIVIRTVADPTGVAEGLGAALRARVPGLAPNIRTMSLIIADATATWHMTLTIFGVFALFAIALSAIGLYGWVSLTVEERTHEIGIRIALGATRGDVMRLLAQTAGRVLVPGAVAGLIMFLAVGRLVQALVFNVSSRDPVALASAIVIMATVAAAAIYRPSIKAAQVDPLQALRAE